MSGCSAQSVDLSVFAPRGQRQQVPVVTAECCSNRTYGYVLVEVNPGRCVASNNLTSAGSQRLTPVLNTKIFTYTAVSCFRCRSTSCGRFREVTGHVGTARAVGATQPSVVGRPGYALFVAAPLFIPREAAGSAPLASGEGPGSNGMRRVLRRARFSWSRGHVTSSLHLVTSRHVTSRRHVITSCHVTTSSRCHIIHVVTSPCHVVTSPRRHVTMRSVLHRTRRNANRAVKTRHMNVAPISQVRQTRNVRSGRRRSPLKRTISLFGKHNREKSVIGKKKNFCLPTFEGRHDCGCTLLSTGICPLGCEMLRVRSRLRLRSVFDEPAY